MNVAELRVGRWLEMHASNPFASGLVTQYTVPNPEYESAKMMGHSTAGMVTTLECFERIGNVYRFPRAAVHRYTGGQYPIIDETVEGEEHEIRSLITPRDYQHPFIAGMLERLNNPLRFGATGQAAAGFGKTVAGLEIVSGLGRKTLIIVHKEFLMTQWAERILGTEAAAERLGIPVAALLKDGEEPAQPMLALRSEQVGFVQQNKAEWKGKAIVIAMAQTLLVRDYPEEFYESFGVVLVDECHRFAAPTFQRAIVQFPARYRIGVTATPKRKDGMENVFFGHIGGIAVVGEETLKRKPRVNQIQTTVLVTPDQKKRLMLHGRINYTKVVTFLVRHEARNRMIVRMLRKAVEKGRKVLLLSDRKEHVETLREMFKQECAEHKLEVSTDFYVGGMDLQARKQAEKMQVLFATYQMAGEGLDIPALDTLFMVTPRGPDMIEQFVGRILRTMDEKMEPVLVDFVDQKIGICAKSAQKRKKEYDRKGWLTT
jgi:superfamily II DNA or RNA helicase